MDILALFPVLVRKHSVFPTEDHISCRLAQVDLKFLSIRRTISSAFFFLLQPTSRVSFLIPATTCYDCVLESAVFGVKYLAWP